MIGTHDTKALAEWHLDLSHRIESIGHPDVRSEVFDRYMMLVDDLAYHIAQVLKARGFEVEDTSDPEPWTAAEAEVWQDDGFTDETWATWISDQDHSQAVEDLEQYVAWAERFHASA